jgi:hypothetical protein
MGVTDGLKPDGQTTLLGGWKKATSIRPLPHRRFYLKYLQKVLDFNVFMS